MKRSLAALAVLAAVSGCTAQAVDADGKAPPAVRTDGSTSPTPTTTAKDKDKDDKPAPAAAKVLWSSGDKGTDVREVQARLHQVAWLITAPTGTYDSATASAVKGFQGKRGLPQTGELDAVTWERLKQMTHKPPSGSCTPMAGSRPRSRTRAV